MGYVPQVAHGVFCREALAAAYPNWLEGIAKYHMEDVQTLFTEVFGVDPAVIETGCARLRERMKQGGVPLSLSAYGDCPAPEYIFRALAPEDFGEFTHEEMVRMVSACYQ